MSSRGKTAPAEVDSDISFENLSISAKCFKLVQQRSDPGE